MAFTLHYTIAYELLYTRPIHNKPLNPTPMYFWKKYRKQYGENDNSTLPIKGGSYSLIASTYPILF